MSSNIDYLEHQQWLRSPITVRLIETLYRDMERLRREAEVISIDENPVDQRDERIKSKLSRAYQIKQILDLIEKPTKEE